MNLITFLLGLVLRFVALDSRDFWFDEAITYHFSRLGIKDLIMAVSTDNNPPFYYLLMHYIQKISSNEIFLRLPSLFANLLTIFLIYLLFKNLLKKNVAFMAASFFSASPLAIYLATEARLHSFAALFSTLNIWAFLQLIKRPKDKNILIFVLISILSVYTQYYLVFLLIPMTLIVVFQRQALKITMWIFVVFLILVAMLPWLAISLQTTHNGCLCPNTILSLPSSLVSPILAGVGIVTLRSFVSLPIWILFFFSLATIVTLVFFASGLKTLGKISFIYTALIIFLSFTGLFFPVFSPKGFSAFSPIFFLITASGISQTKSPKKYFMLVFSLLLFVSTIQITNSYFLGEPLRQIAEITLQKPSPVVHTSLATYYSLNFYQGGKQPQILVSTNPLNPKTLEFIGGEEQTLSENTPNIWFIDYSKWAEINSYQKEKANILSAFRVKETFPFNNIQVLYLEKR